MMELEEKKKFLTVVPFECAWGEEFRFREAGRGCISFEASAQNDVTLVFREQIGSRHYHYKMDYHPHYTIILGSHRNRRLKIEVDGMTVVDVASTGLCCSSSFQSYWISIYDGLISVGKGLYPFQNLVFQWLDERPRCKVQYIGLCSWDKHVSYRNITVLPLEHNSNFLWGKFHYKGLQEGTSDWEGAEFISDNLLTLRDFCENWEFSDLVFEVGYDRKAVPAHKLVLGVFGEIPGDLVEGHVFKLPSVSYAVAGAFLEFIYTGRTQITEEEVGTLLTLAKQFQVLSLIKKCQEIIIRVEKNRNQVLTYTSATVEIVNDATHLSQLGGFSFETHLNLEKLKCYLSTGEASDVNIYIAGYGLVARAHKIVLSLQSPPFAKMFTNGMMESSSSDVSLQDISPEAFSLLLKFMYCGELELNEMEMSPLLLDLLLLSDQFGITMLQRECSKRISQCLSEHTVCPVLEAVSLVPSCKMLEETCKCHFAMHFDYCTTANSDFVVLDEATFKEILQHPDMTVTSEEKVLNAILVWSMQADEMCGWVQVDELLSSSNPVELFRERICLLDSLLPFVRFPLMPSSLLDKLKNSRLYEEIPILMKLVEEAIQFINAGSPVTTIAQSERYQYRWSSYKKLQYICDGDNNGVIYYSGTSYGEHQWVNPVLARKIMVTASSPASRYTDPKALVSRTYQATCLAGPRTEDGRNCSWWMVDLGRDHQLMCNYYTVRQDGSANFMRFWAFQGSMDGENWTNLRVHENDQTLCRPGQFASWPVSGTSALLPFRFFRVILMGPTAGDNNSLNLCICFIEMYGYFR
ncbi:BTB/POZ domain-containing protein [Rhynchospora pubera]|uniref:BTB/POZ domain-containing protein n=1 Tax=Rhynchospora pubera TaxID=906938 RepID=A0AAV8DTR9_9POAL|nr:BTB/POZ domain-containing protein [Rhynchospora pubera]